MAGRQLIGLEPCSPAHSKQSRRPNLPRVVNDSDFGVFTGTCADHANQDKQVWCIDCVLSDESSASHRGICTQIMSVEDLRPAPGCPGPAILPALAFDKLAVGLSHNEHISMTMR
jgi:hypothetical protein